MAHKQKKSRLDKDQWLAQALEVVSRKGRARFRIDQMVQEIGVTKGSFYWHFKNRSDFVKSLADYWAVNSTERVIDMVKQRQDDARGRAFFLMETVHKNNSVKYDATMRAWALHDPNVAKTVKQVDKQRLEFGRSLFHEMGFRGEELEMRSRIFIYYLAGSHVFYAPEKKKDILKQLKQRCDFLTKP